MSSTTPTTAPMPQEHPEGPATADPSAGVSVRALLAACACAAAVSTPPPAPVRAAADGRKPAAPPRAA